MQGADEPSRLPRTLFTFNSKADVQQFATGCDGDIGGTSTVHLDFDESPANSTSIEKPGTGKFWGEMRLGVRSGLEGKLRGGYAGFRNKQRPTMFGHLMDDVSNHRYLALRLRLAGDMRTHNSYFVNIQTDGPITTDLWQHRLYFQRHDSTWEDLFIPFDNFVRTNSGELSEDQIPMYREKVRSIGISLLGGNSGTAGKYELGIDSIRIVNDEDVTRTSGKLLAMLGFHPPDRPARPRRYTQRR
ncbi:complex I intermediate-associated protein 30-domain-containing protein [Infundibulicybe gibba]|nr:complex I intermediate-associated protein 30-domain-containing protein [Infundibulicybe gibba]